MGAADANTRTQEQGQLEKDLPFDPPEQHFVPFYCSQFDFCTFDADLDLC